MNRGIVIGEVWATRKTPRFSDRKWLLVAITAHDGAREWCTGRVVVAADCVEAGPGDRVVVVFGSGARNAVSPKSRDVLVDAAVVQVIEGSTPEGPSTPPRSNGES